LTGSGSQFGAGYFFWKFIRKPAAFKAAVPGGVRSAPFVIFILRPACGIVKVPCQKEKGLTNI